METNNGKIKCPHFNKTWGCKIRKASSEDTGVSGIKLCRASCEYRCCLRSYSPGWCVRVPEMNVLEQFEFYKWTNKNKVRGI